LKSTIASRVVAWCALLSAVACSKVLGIEDAHLDPTFTPTGGSTGSGPSILCKSYCDTVMASCTGVFSVYATLDTCLAICPHLPEGTAGEMSGNSIQCRMSNAMIASSEPSFYCPAAGPGGNGVCGTNCDSLCTLAAAICTEPPKPFTSDDDCHNDCAALPDLGTFSTDSSKEMYEGPSVECRLFHVSAASVADATVHCTHVGGAAPCVPQMPTGS
jgi:hypothetical protein